VVDTADGAVAVAGAGAVAVGFEVEVEAAFAVAVAVKPVDRAVTAMPGAGKGAAYV
jgi:hypothetical protein